MSSTANNPKPLALFPTRRGNWGGRGEVIGMVVAARKTGAEYITRTVTPQHLPSKGVC
jgi:hypothetical protein